MELVAKKTAKAPVWDYFGFQPDEKGEPLNLCEPICRMCSKPVLSKASTTSNMIMHIKYNHPVQFSELGKKNPTPTQSTSTAAPSKQSTITTLFSRQTKYKQDSAKWSQLTDNVVCLLAKEMLPFNLIEKPAFRKMLRSFDSQYEPPSRNYVSQTAIPRLYNTMKSDILKELQDIAFFSATTDMWSSSNMTPYMSLTIHYIAADWTLHTKCLETRYVPENHTADTLAENLKAALAEWQWMRINWHASPQTTARILWLQSEMWDGNGLIALATTSTLRCPMALMWTENAQPMP